MKATHAAPKQTKAEQPHEELEVFKFLKQTRIEDYDPKAWHSVLENDLKRVRAKNRDEKSKSGQLDKIRVVFANYVFRFPAAAFALAASATAAILFSAPAFRQSLTLAGLAAAAAAAFAIALCLAVFWTHWSFVEFERNKERRRFHELRHRNWHAIEYQLSTLQRVYEVQSQNEDPEKGPKGLMGARLLSRHLWELVYLLKLDAELFNFDLKENVFDKAGYRLAHLTFFGAGVGVALAAVGVFKAVDPLLVQSTMVFAAGTVAAWATYGFVAPAVRTKSKLVAKLFEPALDAKSCALIGMAYGNRHELEWSPRFDYDELRDYLVWLKTQLRTMKDLKENKPGVRTQTGD